MHSQHTKCLLLVCVVLALSSSLVSSCQSAPRPTATPTLKRTTPLAPTTSTGESVPRPTATPPPEPVNPGLTLGTPCSPPCWLDIRPGITTLEEAETILKHYSDQGIVLSWRDYVQGECAQVGVVVWEVSTHSRFANALITFKDDVVYRITVVPPNDSYAYTLGELVDRYGPPELVSHPQWNCSGCDTAREARGERIGLRLYYPGKGMMFDLYVSFLMGGCMCRDMVIEFGTYFTPMPFSELRRRLVPLDAPPPDYTYCDNFLYVGFEEPLVEWHGFGPGYGAETDIDLSIVN